MAHRPVGALPALRPLRSLREHITDGLESRSVHALPDVLRARLRDRAGVDRGSSLAGAPQPLDGAVGAALCRHGSAYERFETLGPAPRIGGIEEIENRFGGKLFG